jgi:microcystin-dependent protein
MVEPFLSEIKIVSFNFAPKGWALCNGQLLPINQNQALFALLGTTYGGDGRVNFALPYFQGRAPIHFGNGYTLGQAGGETSHTLTLSEMPNHNHAVTFSSAVANTNAVNNNNVVPARTTTPTYAPPNALVPMAPNVLSTIGGSQEHNNMQPYLVLNFIIALQGIFPSQN